MVGVDLRTECKTASQRLGIPILAVEAPGIAGGKQTGHRLAVRLLCEQVIGTIEPAFRGRADINLIGEFNVHGEVAQLRLLLRSLGIRILASIPGDARYQEIAMAHRAKVSLDLCSQAMPQLAEKLTAQYGIPFVRGSVYGSRAFAETLRRLVHMLVANGADAEIAQKAEAWLESEQQRFQAALARYRSRLDGKRVMIYAGGVKIWSLIVRWPDCARSLLA
jgi:nitrogenase molybdenum-cofactor synthesis protein NifE